MVYQSSPIYEAMSTTKDLFPQKVASCQRNVRLFLRICGWSQSRYVRYIILHQLNLYLGKKNTLALAMFKSPTCSHVFVLCVCLVLIKKFSIRIDLNP